MSASPRSTDAAPFTVLTEFLQNAYKSSGSISIPSQVLEPFRTRSTPFDTSRLRSFARLFDSSRHANRLRLGSASFVAIVSIILQLPHSLVQDKLLYTFMRTTQYLKNDDCKPRSPYKDSSVAELQRYRDEVSRGLVRNVLKVTTEVSFSLHIKRTAIQFLYCIIANDRYAQELISTESSLCRILCSSIYTDPDIVFRILVADLIRELLINGTDRTIFWRDDTPSRNVDRFPTSVRGDLSWLERMFEYLDRTGSNFHLDNDGATDFFCVRQLSIDEDVFQSPHASIFAVVTSRALTFVVSSEAEPNLQLREFSLLPDLVMQTSSGWTPTSGMTAEQYGASESGRNDDLILKYARNDGYQILEGTKHSVSEVRFARGNGNDPARLTALLISDDITQSANGRHEIASSAPTGSARKSDVAFVTGPAESDYEWWSQRSRKDSIAKDHLNVSSAARKDSSDKRQEMPLESEVASSGSNNRNNSALHPKSQLMTGAEQITESCQFGLGIEGAIATQTGNPPVNFAQQAHGVDAVGYEEEGAIPEQSPTSLAPTPNTRQFELGAVKIQNVIHGTSTGILPDMPKLAQKASINPAQSNLATQVTDQTLANANRTGDLPASPILKQSMARSSKAVAIDKSAKLAPLLTTGTSRSSQCGLKQKKQKSQNDRREEEVDWDEALREEQVSKNQQKRNLKSVKELQQPAAGDAKGKKMKGGSKKAKAVAGKSHNQKKIYSPDKETLASTRGRRAKPVKSAQYIVDSDTQDDEELEQDQPTVPAKSSSAEKPGPRRSPQPAPSKFQDGVKYSQQKTAGKDKVQEAEASADDGLQIIPENMNYSNGFPQSKDRTNLRVTGDQIQKAQNERLVGLTSHHADVSEHDNHQIEGQRDHAGERPSDAVVDASQHIAALECAVQDSNPRERKDDNANTSNVSFGSKMSRYIETSTSQTGNTMTTPWTSFGNAKTFVDAVNGAKEVSTSKKTPGAKTKPPPQSPAAHSISEIAKPVIKKVDDNRYRTEVPASAMSVTKQIDQMGLRTTPAKKSSKSLDATLIPPEDRFQVDTALDMLVTGEGPPKSKPTTSIEKNVKSSRRDDGNTRTQHSHTAKRVREEVEQSEIAPKKARNHSNHLTVDLPDPFVDRHEVSTSRSAHSLKELEPPKVAITEGVKLAKMAILTDTDRLPSAAELQAKPARKSASEQRRGFEAKEAPARPRSTQALQTPRPSALASTDDSLMMTDESLHRKINLVHFGQSGPQNQGVLSHVKISRASINPRVPPPETEKHDEFKEQQTKAGGHANGVFEPPFHIAAEENGIIVSDEAKDEGTTGVRGQPAFGRHASQGSRVDEYGSPYLQLQPDFLLPDPSSQSAETPNSRSAVTSATSTSEEEPESNEIQEQDGSEYLDSETVDDSALSVEPTEQLPEASKRINNRATSPPELSPQPQRSRGLLSKMTAVQLKRPKAARQSFGLTSMIDEAHPHAPKHINVAPLMMQANSNPDPSSRLMPPPRTRIITHPVAEEFRFKTILQSKKQEKLAVSPAPVAVLDFPHLGAKSSSTIPVRVRRVSHVPSSEPETRDLSPDFRTKLLNQAPSVSSRPLKSKREREQTRARYGTMFDDGDTTLVVHGIAAEGSCARQALPTWRYTSRESTIDSSPPSSTFGISRQTGTMIDRQKRVGNLRATQQSVRDIVIEVADSLLFRLQDEETAIRSKVEAYRSGGLAVLDRLQWEFNADAAHSKQEVYKEARALRRDAATGHHDIEQRYEYLWADRALMEIQQVTERRRTGLLARLNDGLERQREAAGKDE